MESDSLVCFRRLCLVFFSRNSNTCTFFLFKLILLFAYRVYIAWPISVVFGGCLLEL